MEKNKQEGKMVSRGPAKGMDNVDIAKEHNFRGDAGHPGDSKNAAGAGKGDNEGHEKYGSGPVSNESIDKGEG